MDQNKAARGGPAESKFENPSQQREVVRDRDRADQSGTEQPEAITVSEVETVEERSRLPAPLIYEIVRRMGEEEMARPVSSLWWSGVAAGLSISFSLLAQAVLQAGPFAGRFMAAVDHQPRLSGWISDRCPRPPAALHRKYHYRRIAGCRGVYGGQPDCGRSCSQPI